MRAAATRSALISQATRGRGIGLVVGKISFQFASYEP